MSTVRGQQVPKPYPVPNPSGSKLGKAWNKAQQSKDITCYDFFLATDGVNGFAQRKLICALDETGLWELILADNGMLDDGDVAAEMVQRKKAWEEDQISPTNLMINDLLHTSFASSSMIEFAEYLIKKGNPDITSIMQGWLEKVKGKITNAQKAGVKRFEIARNLNQFFMDLVNHQDGVFTASMIPGIVSKLQADHINTIKLLERLSDDQLSNKYGLTMGQCFVLRDALDEAKKLLIN
jgi:hypothetical protein